AIINPSYMPGPSSPVDFQAMPADAFRALFEHCEYREVRKFGGVAQWSIFGVFTCKDRANENEVATRLALVNDDKQIAFVDLSPNACLELARYLIEFAIASGNTNGQPQTAADGLIQL